MIRGGAMRTRCLFEKPARVDDQYGNAYNGWVKVCSVWGWLRPTPGREAVIAGRLDATSTGTLRVQDSPYTRGIDPSHRVTITRKGVATVYQIRGQPIDQEQTGQEIDFLVERGVAP